RQRVSARMQQRGEKQIEGPETPALQLLGERLDADADSGRQRAAFQRDRDMTSSICGICVLFVVGPVSKTVLEIDPEILDRLAPQLVDETGVETCGERTVDPECGGERVSVGRVGVQRPPREVAELLHRVGLE